MKLRIRGNSIRIRLMQKEVEELARNGRIEEHVLFPAGDTFAYRLQIVSEYNAHLASDEMEVSIPKEEANIWIASESLSLSTSLPLIDGKQLRLLIEKDLACLTEREDEDESDAFPNPNTNC